MTYDHRLVQTATLSGPRSYEPVFLPMERHFAEEFKGHHQNSTFWCGELLGGCGGRLGVKIYEEKVAHFAHYSSTNRCTRQHGGIESADHLFAGQQVNRWLDSHGLPQREPLFEGDFANGGTCHRLTLPAGEEEPTILFEFTTRMDPGVQRLLTQGLDRPQAWFVRDNPELVQRLVHSNGHGLRFRMRTDRFERKVDVGTTSSDGHTWWRPIEDCSLEMKRSAAPPPVTLPEEEPRPLQAPSSWKPGSKAPKEILPHPLFGRLRAALEDRDWSVTRLLTERLRRLLESAGDIGITHFRREAEELLTVSRKALRYLLPTATLIVRSPEGTAAPVSRGRPVAVPVPKQGRTAPQTGGVLSAQQRGKKRNRKRNRHVKPMPPTPAQISESVSKVDERALLKLQERFNTRRM